jgi:hypothetical protein
MPTTLGRGEGTSRYLGRLCARLAFFHLRMESGAKRDAVHGIDRARGGVMTAKILGSYRHAMGVERQTGKYSKVPYTRCVKE